MDKNPKRLLITGAGKRVGAALARHFSARGWELVLHYRNSRAEAEALAKELGNATLVQADLADTKRLPDFWKGLPNVTALIHNASSFARDTLATMTPDSLREHVAIHLEAPLLLSQGFMRQLPDGANGSILMLGDGELGWSVAPAFFSYAVTKHAWQSVVDVLAAASAPRVRANVLALGATLPSIHDDEGTLERLRVRMPLKRNSSPADVCAAAEFLLGASDVTGQVLSLADGLGLASFRHTPLA